MIKKVMKTDYYGTWHFKSHCFPSVYNAVQLMRFATPREGPKPPVSASKLWVYSKWGLHYLVTLWLYNAVKLTYFLCRTTCFKFWLALGKKGLDPTLNSFHEGITQSN